MSVPVLRRRPVAAATAALAVSATAASISVLPAQARTRSATGFQEVKLVADQPGHAATTDKNLVNAWGLAASPSSPLWVSNNGTNTSTLYQGAMTGQSVQKVPLTVKIPAGGAPTGTVFNPTSGFRLSSGGKSGSALFLFAGENGDVFAWNQTGAMSKAVRVVHTPDAVYKGITISRAGGKPLLLAADFHNDRIAMWNQSFAPVHRAHAFVGRNVPAGYAPFDVADLGGRVYVTYAKQDAARHDDVAGAGHGFLNVFRQNGRFVKTLVSRGVLDSPWGLAVAPSGFGPYAGKLLVGNFGNGRIHVVDPMSGTVLATLRNQANKPIVIDGLWGLLPGNGTAGATSDVWFSAGPDGEAHGLLGILRHP